MPRPPRSAPPPPAAADPPDDGGAAELNYRQAQTALELTLAELQTRDLDVEAMASMYRRAQAYADRCETLLAQVEQEVMQWDPDQPDLPPQSFQP
jgi:exodeoxyribonuclease VII small subunit